MPILTIDGYGKFEVEEGKRLVLAFEDNEVDILHRCGGFARCTTCRAEFLDGESQRRAAAEYLRLEQEGCRRRSGFPASVWLKRI